MRSCFHILFLMALPLLFSCNEYRPVEIIEPGNDSISMPGSSNNTSVPVAETTDTLQTVVSAIKPIDTQKVKPHHIVDFAKTLIGVPYKYASTDPAQGFDCSGFITYVFRHFNIAVPRSSVDFTNVGRNIVMNEAKTGDLILFTGTDSLSTVVGHMGIVTENTDSLRFIHSTSGRQYGVTITSMGNYYQRRFVKVIRIF